MQLIVYYQSPLDFNCFYLCTFDDLDVCIEYPKFSEIATPFLMFCLFIFVLVEHLPNWKMM